MQLVDEVVGYAKANMTAAKTADEQHTWGAHWRNCCLIKNEIDALRNDFAALQHALVGDSGLSAIQEAHRLRKLHPLQKSE